MGAEGDTRTVRNHLGPRAWPGPPLPAPNSRSSLSNSCCSRPTTQHMNQYNSINHTNSSRETRGWTPRAAWRRGLRNPPQSGPSWHRRSASLEPGPSPSRWAVGSRLSYTWHMPGPQHTIGWRCRGLLLCYLCWHADGRVVKAVQCWAHRLLGDAWAPSALVVPLRPHRCTTCFSSWTWRPRAPRWGDHHGQGAGEMFLICTGPLPNGVAPRRPTAPAIWLMQRKRPHTPLSLLVCHGRRPF